MRNPDLNKPLDDFSIPGFQKLAGATVIEGQPTYVPVQTNQFKTDENDAYVDWSRGIFQVLLLNVPTTNIHLVRPVNGQTCSLLLVQDGVGGRGVEWKADYLDHPLDTDLYPTIKWMAGGFAPELSTDANAGDMISLKWLQVPLKVYWGMYTLWMI